MRSAFDGQAVKAKIAIFLRSSFSGNKAENLGAGLGFQSRVLMVQSCDYDAAGTDGVKWTPEQGPGIGEVKV